MSRPSAEVRTPAVLEAVDARVVRLSLAAGLLAFVMGFVALLLTALIAGITQLAWYQRLSLAHDAPGDAHLALPWAVVVPVVGGLIVGVMARFGSTAIRGHGIPEAMERVLFHESRIPARMTWLKPLSAAVAIGTGGPFGAEGPIIATGGALGSLLGQVLHVTADERKALLAAGAAAGMAATFGAPVSAVLLAIELLLFELRPRSVIPVALAACVATGVRYATVGTAPAFAMPDLGAPGGGALAVYVAVGVALGVVAVAVSRLVYGIEDAFERLPLHWSWWPALGGVVVGVVGYISPRTLGVGYTNIEDILSARLVGVPMIVFALFKLVSWSVALGSGTSGGTLAPLFTLGGAAGAALGAVAAWLLPAWGVDPRMAALVGMAAMFAGASRALLASVVFAFEITRQPLGLLPLLGGCAGAYLVAGLLGRTSIMTEKIARRGQQVPSEYAADPLLTTRVGEHATRDVVSVVATASVAEVRDLLARVSHRGFPVSTADGELVGVVTARDVLTASPDARVRDVLARPLAVAFEDDTLRAAADLMIVEHVGRLPVVARAAPTRVVGILTRSDVLAAHRGRIEAEVRRSRVLSWGAAPARDAEP